MQQPYMNVQPGFSLWQHGSQLNRHTTWWPEGKWWAQYVHRGQFVLQSGKPKADVLFLAGDGSPNGASNQADLVDAGYSYDNCGAADIQRLEVRDGGVAMPGCLPYSVLCLNWMGAPRNARFSGISAMSTTRMTSESGSSPAKRLFPAER